MNTLQETAAGCASERQLTLALLTAVHRNSAVSQRQIARDLGVALGLANAYIKRCIRKGYVKVTHAPANRYLYYLTPHGFSEKARLSAEYLGQSFHFFRTTRAQCEVALDRACAAGFSRVVLAGVSDLTEITALCATEKDLQLTAIIDATLTRRSVAGVPVVANLDQAGEVDAVIITALEDAQALFDSLVERLGPDRVIAPAMLGLVAAATETDE